MTLSMDVIIGWILGRFQSFFKYDSYEDSTQSEGISSEVSLNSKSLAKISKDKHAVLSPDDIFDDQGEAEVSEDSDIETICSSEADRESNSFADSRISSSVVTDLSESLSDISFIEDPDMESESYTISRISSSVITDSDESSSELADREVNSDRFYSNNVLMWCFVHFEDLNTGRFYPCKFYFKFTHGQPSEVSVNGKIFVPKY